MKISEAWLREWVNPPLSGEALATQLTMAGISVESRNPVAGDFNQVIVARVVAVARHPKADKLTICQLDTGGTEPIQVVCGAANVRSGLTVALALPGAVLPGDFRIEPSLLRGEPSNGMLCSATELGLTDESEGILELPDDAVLGTDFRDYFSLNDTVFDFELTPNRGDCLSVLGIARELSALNQLPLPEQPNPVIPIGTQDTINVTIDAPKLRINYCGRIIKQINLAAQTPLWMKERLRRSGIRTIHPVVDVMNYVMLELGQPLHAFDLGSISGDISVRYAKVDESLTLLDGQSLALKPQALVIADKEQSLCLAGIMGGANSAVTVETSDIFLESVFFDPLSVGPIARGYHLSTDSSLRFERGVDPTLQIIALERASELLLNIVGGIAGPITQCNQATQSINQPIVFNPAKVKRLTGLELSLETLRHLLEWLGMGVSIETDAWLITTPSYRFDLVYEVDIIEEIVRLYGYDKIPSIPTIAPLKPVTISKQDSLAERIGFLFSDRGYAETITYSFVDPQLQTLLYPTMQAMQLLNPISSELSHMRVGLWPGLIASMIYNSHRQQVGLRLFEMGTVFNLSQGELQEKASVGGLITGEFGHLDWSLPTYLVDFFDMKGDLEALFRQLKVVDYSFVKAEHDALHPGQSAQIIINDKPAGWIGVLHPRFMNELDLNHDVILFELTLNELTPKVPAYRRLSKYPHVRRDISFLINNDISAADIEKTIHSVLEQNIVKSFNVFDAYHGKEIPSGQKSLAIALFLQEDTRTLIDEEINSVVSKLVNELKLKFNIILRE